MNVNVAALQPVSAAFDHQATDGFITAGADYHVKTAPAFDVGGGVPLGERRGVGIGPSRAS